MINIKEIAKAVALEFRIPDIRIRKRSVENVNARMTYSYILRQLGYSYKEIGRSLGKDHSTVIHYVRRIKWYAQADAPLKKKFDSLCSTFIDGLLQDEDEDDGSNYIKREAEIIQNDLKNQINALKSEIKSLNLELSSAKGRQQFNEQDMERFENIFKVVKQRTRHGDEYKVFQKLNSMYNVI